ncbi:MAG: hypothetical protein AB1758_38505, partial [Candidatus Eremiobacterota bacterium]
MHVTTPDPVTSRPLLGRAYHGGIGAPLWDRTQSARQKLAEAGAWGELEGLDGLYETACEGLTASDPDAPMLLS